MDTAQHQTSACVPQRELDKLLSESRVDAGRRAAARFTLNKGEAIALYGAGQLGRQVLARLRSIGVEPVTFADDTPAKQGTLIDNLPVVSPEEFAEQFGDRAVFVVTIFNPAASFLRISERLTGETRARVVSFLEVAWKYPAVFLPHYQFELPHDVLANDAIIRRAFSLFADDESRRQFVAHLRFRLHLDFKALPKSNLGDYFPAGVVPKLSPATTFVDCGAFDGDTIRRFINCQRGSFREIYAFEPDAENFRKLSAYVQSLGADVSKRTHLFRAAVGAHSGRMRFNASGGMGSMLTESGAEEVDVVALQDVLRPRDNAAFFLKFDVEGGEAAALDGARALINRALSVVAVCVYHQPDDLWELPLKLRALAPRHKLFLRTQGEDGMDVVCYAVPDRWTN